MKRLREITLLGALTFLPGLVLRVLAWVGLYLWRASLRDLLLILPRLAWFLLGQVLRINRISVALIGAVVGVAWYGLFVLSPLRPIVRDALMVVGRTAISCTVAVPPSTPQRSGAWSQIAPT